MRSHIEDFSSPPTILMCSERAGSNLLRCLFDAHTDVYAPNTMALGHLCVEYHNSKEKSQSSWKDIVQEASRRINESTFYTGVSVHENELMENVAQHDSCALYLYAYRKGMRLFGARRVVIKEHQAWLVVPFVMKAHPDTKIIVQVRDPRDHAVSCKRLAGLYETYHGSVQRAARMWANDQRAALGLSDELGDTVVRIHRYEELVRQPRPTLADIFAFLDLPWQNSVLDFHSLEAAKKERSKQYLLSMWANLDKPITADSAGRWEGRLTPCEVRVIEQEAGELLHRFGYGTAPRNSGVSAACHVYRYASAVRFFLVTLVLWLGWLLRTGNYRVPKAVLLGTAVRGHRPYERFRDRLGYRL